MALWGCAWSLSNDVSLFLAGPGISGYSHTTEKAGPSLAQCLRQAEEVIPSNQHQETPVYLGATAGMRLLRYCRACPPFPAALRLGPPWMLSEGHLGKVLGSAASSCFAQIPSSATGVSEP